MQEYTAPELKLILFEASDVITTSEPEIDDVADLPVL